VTATPRYGQSWYVTAPFHDDSEPAGPDVWLVRLHGDIDLDSAPMAAEALHEHIVAPARMVVIDLSGVTFCSSSGLRVLAEAARRAAELSIELRLVGAGRPVRRPMDITGLGTHFLTFTSVASALAHGVPSN